MRVRIEGEVKVVAMGCTASELGIEAARQLLAPVVQSLRVQNPSREAMLDLFMGMLAGTIGHFGADLTVEEIHEQLDNCKRMVSEVPGFMPGVQMQTAGKAVH